MKSSKKNFARNTRRLRYGSAAIILTVVVIAAVVLLNVLVGVVADKYPITWDLSKDKVFTLSEDSVKMAERVTDEVEIVVFSPQSDFEQPTIGDYYGMPELNTSFKEFYTALQQYETHSDGKVTYTFIDPDKEPTKFAAYNKYEVAAGDILFLSGERHKTCTILDMSNFADAYTEYYSYGTYTFESKVEKVMASTIHSLQGDNDRIVQVLTGHDEDSSTISGLKALYELNGFTFENLNITSSAEINPKAEVMLIAAPSKDYSDAEIKRIQQWVYNDGNYGHHLMVYVSPTAACPNLYEFLKVEYEITVTDELLIETDADYMWNYTAYPATSPLCDVPNTEYSSSAVGNAVVCTPFARRLTTTLKTAPDQEDATIYTIGLPLLEYSESAKLMKLETLTGQNENAEPYAPAESEYPLTSMIVCEINDYNNNLSSDDPDFFPEVSGTVLVSGCPYFAASDITQMSYFNNENLLLDIVHGIFGEEENTISNKVIQTGTVVFSADVQKIVGLWIFTIGLPVVLLVICLVVFLRRKNL